jgi:hypothetical protein
MESAITKEITYKKSKHLDDEDIDHSSFVYDYNLHNANIEIVLGKEKHTYSKYNVVYFPIYLVVNENIMEKIGIFEIDSNNVISSIDDEGGIDLKQGHLLFFIEKASLHSIIEEDNTDKEEPSEERSEEPIDNQDEPRMEVTELTDDPTRIHIDELKKTKSSVVAEKIVSDGVVSVDRGHKELPILPEENKTDSEREKADYKDLIHNNWVVKFTHNNNYNILDNENGNDSLFAVFRDSLKEKGIHTTADKLRATISQEATQEIYEKYRTIYLNYIAEMQEIDRKMKTMKATNVILKKRCNQTKGTLEKEEHQKLLDEAADLEKKHAEIIKLKRHARQLYNQMAFMDNIHSFQEFQEFILSGQYKPDAWGKDILENELKVKLIILSEDACKQGDNGAVLQCGKNMIQNVDKNEPEYYIIVTESNQNTYRIVSYKNKKLLTFREVPYDMKSLVVNKCLEEDAGEYTHMNDFRNFKTRLGLDPELGHTQPDEEEYKNNEYYSGDATLMFHAKSRGKVIPGRGAGEDIISNRVSEFNDLHLHQDWRRKLDDSWGAPITLDNKKWNSVSHFVLGSQYKKGFPDFYNEFSIDSDSKMSSDVELAKSAAGKSGEHNGNVLRPENVKTDPDYFEIGVNIPHDVARLNALREKFHNHIELRSILSKTRDAKLLHYVIGAPAEIDLPLMKVRSEVRERSVPENLQKID